MTAVVRSQEERHSPHTGRALALLEVQGRLVSDDATKHELGRSLQTRGSVVTSADGRRFRVGSSSYSYSDDSAVTTLNMELEEIEVVTASAVVIGGGLTLTPERYKEEHNHGAVIIEMMATTTGADTEALEIAIAAQTDGAHFPVLREGVRPEALEMRFGKCLWKDQEDGSRRHLVVLVERPYDESDAWKFMGFEEPQLSRALEAVASLQVIAEALVNTTVSAGLISAADADSLRREARNVSRRQHRQFRRAEKLEEFWTD